jgi:hypothetical protein
MKMKEIKVGVAYATYSQKTCGYRYSAQRMRVVERYVERRDGYYGDLKENGVRVVPLDRGTGVAHKNEDGTDVTRVIASREVRETWVAFSARMDEVEENEREAREDSRRRQALTDTVRERIKALLPEGTSLSSYATRLTFTDAAFLRLLELAEIAGAMPAQDREQELAILAAEREVRAKIGA